MITTNNQQQEDNEEEEDEEEEEEEEEMDEVIMNKNEYDDKFDLDEDQQTLVSFLLNE